jgi:hypothetical protein
VTTAATNARPTVKQAGRSSQRFREFPYAQGWLGVSRQLARMEMRVVSNPLVIPGFARGMRPADRLTRHANRTRR